MATNYYHCVCVNLHSVGNLKYLKTCLIQEMLAKSKHIFLSLT